MRRNPVAMLVCLPLALAKPLYANVLPDACGSDAVSFKVKVAEATKKQPMPPALEAPEAGKAQIVFVELVDSSGIFVTTPTTRFGVDGQWVGADRGGSYFALTVTPGEHHLCANWQSEDKWESSQVGMAPLTAEAGKVYYFAAKIVRNNYNHGTTASFDFVELNDDEGKYRVKALWPSTFTPEKNAWESRR